MTGTVAFFGRRDASRKTRRGFPECLRFWSASSSSFGRRWTISFGSDPPELATTSGDYGTVIDSKGWRLTLPTPRPKLPTEVQRNGT